MANNGKDRVILAKEEALDVDDILMTINNVLYTKLAKYRKMCLVLYSKYIKELDIVNMTNEEKEKFFRLGDNTAKSNIKYANLIELEKYVRTNIKKNTKMLDAIKNYHKLSSFANKTSNLTLLFETLGKTNEKTNEITNIDYFIAISKEFKGLFSFEISKEYTYFSKAELTSGDFEKSLDEDEYFKNNCSLLRLNIDLVTFSKMSLNKDKRHSIAVEKIVNTSYNNSLSQELSNQLILDMSYSYTGV